MASKTTLAARVGWELGTQLGKGGQGDVFLAVRSGNSDGQNYAFKFLNDKGNETALARFRQELDALTKIDHRGVIKVIDHSKEGEDFQYYVMEYVDGSRPLHKLIATDDNPFFRNPLKAVDGFIQIVEALAACEKRRIIHRDLSPANTLVTKDERIILIDFGLCHIDNGQTLTMTDEAVGTPNYRAPECSGHSRHEPTIRADLYSAGKLLWSMITNQIAFDREELVFNDLALAKVLPDVPMSWHLHHIFEKTIRKDPAKRYHDTFTALEGVHKVRRLIVEGFKPLEQLAENVCPICGVGKYGDTQRMQSTEGIARFYNQTQAVNQAYELCPYCFHASFVAFDALRDALKARKNLL